mmetsp:Transcript_7075/g.16155  ORF Transcript_7075/g.16155 Transcript_7075/m.16155 type:complete len:203 (-) Transcript_7075:135-743(-)
MPSSSTRWPPGALGWQRSRRQRRPSTLSCAVVAVSAASFQPTRMCRRTGTRGTATARLASRRLRWAGTATPASPRRWRSSAPGTSQPRGCSRLGGPASRCRCSGSPLTPTTASRSGSRSSPPARGAVTSARRFSTSPLASLERPRSALRRGRMGGLALRQQAPLPIHPPRSRGNTAGGRRRCMWDPPSGVEYGAAQAQSPLA